MIPYKTIIVDDEPPARQRLKELLSDYPNTFQLIGEAENATEGLEKIRKLQPDIIFLDIQMPGMSGFELLQQLTEIPIIVFCTAYDEYSLKAFETNSLDYLLKPVRKERLHKTVEKLQFFKKTRHPDQLMEVLREITQSPPGKELTSIAIKKDKRIVFVKLEEVIYFRADSKYVSVYTNKGTEFLTDQSLSTLEQKLPGFFLRIQRSIIINKMFVKEVQNYFNSRYAIVLNDISRTKLISGRIYRDQIKQWIEF